MGWTNSVLEPGKARPAVFTGSREPARHQCSSKALQGKPVCTQGPIDFLPSADLLVRNMERQWGDLDRYRGIATSAAGALTPLLQACLLHVDLACAACVYPTAWRCVEWRRISIDAGTL